MMGITIIKILLNHIKLDRDLFQLLSTEQANISDRFATNLNYNILVLITPVNIV